MSSTPPPPQTPPGSEKKSEEKKTEEKVPETQKDEDILTDIAKDMAKDLDVDDNFLSYLPAKDRIKAFREMKADKAKKQLAEKEKEKSQKKKDKEKEKVPDANNPANGEAPPEPIPQGFLSKNHKNEFLEKVYKHSASSKFDEVMK